MKAKLKRRLALLIGCTTILGLSTESMAADITYVDDVQQVYEAVNQFRTSGTAWYYDENNNKINCGTLPALTYDLSLEEIAKKRAAELPTEFGHVRPDGSSYSTCLASDGSRSYGENILGSPNGTPEYAFELWKEEDKSYADQGHRRNMLSVDYPFTSIGIAHVQYTEETRSYDYWVQEFGYTGNSSAPTIPDPEIPDDDPEIPDDDPEISDDPTINNPETDKETVDGLPDLGSDKETDDDLTSSDPGTDDDLETPTDKTPISSDKEDDNVLSDGALPSGFVPVASSNKSDNKPVQTNAAGSNSAANVTASSQTENNSAANNKAPQTGDNTSFMLSLLGIVVTGSIMMILKLKAKA